MAHMIDETTGKAAMAYVGETPWHGLGQALTPGQSIEVWRREAGLDYTVERTPVLFQLAGDDASSLVHKMPERDVLYRSDTQAALSVVSKGYHVVQPGAVMEWFAKLAEVGGFELETAGALSGGRRIWALAKVNDGAPVIGQDVVRPYVLLATSYDGTLSTTAKFTSIRVVCNNTLTMSAGSGAPEARGQTEVDTIEGPVVQCVRIPHSQVFKGDEVRRQLGIVANAWERHLVNMRLMAEKSVTMEAADKFVFELLSSVQRPPKDRPLPDVRQSRGFKSIMGMFSGDGLIGGDLTGGMNAWRLLNSITEHVDHHAGRTQDSRLTSAWFGAGEGLKNRAFEGLLAMAS